MELIVDIIPLVKGKISVVTGNLFQATIRVSQPSCFNMRVTCLNFE